MGGRVVVVYVRIAAKTSSYVTILIYVIHCYFLLFLFLKGIVFLAGFFIRHSIETGSVLILAVKAISNLFRVSLLCFCCAVVRSWHMMTFWLLPSHTTTTATVTTRLRSIFRVHSFGCGYLLSFRGLCSLRLKIGLNPPLCPSELLLLL